MGLPWCLSNFTSCMQLREKLDDEAVKLLEELFIVEVIFFDMSSVEAVE